MIYNFIRQLKKNKGFKYWKVWCIEWIDFAKNNTLNGYIQQSKCVKKVRTCIDKLNDHIQCFVVSLHPARVTPYFRFRVFHLSATIYTFDFYNPNSVEASFSFSFITPTSVARHYITLCHCKSFVIKLSNVCIQMRQSEVTTNARVNKIWRKSSQHQWHAINSKSWPRFDWLVFLISCLTNDKGKYTRILTGEG